MISSVRVVRLAATPLALALAGCNPVFKTTGEGLLRVAGWQQGDLQAEASDPRAGYLHVTGAADALLVLGFREHGREIWYGAGGVTLTLEQGVVLRASGLPEGDYLVQWSDDAAQALRVGLHTLPAGQSLPLLKTRTLTRHGLTSIQQYAYRLRADGLVPVQLWGEKQRQLLQLRELPEPGVEWPGNRYWLDPDSGEVMASEQWFSPGWRVFLTPREAFARQVVVVSEVAGWRQVVAERQRLSTVLRAQPAAQLQPAHQLVWLATAEFPAASLAARDLAYRLRDLRLVVPAQQATVLARLQQRLQALTPVPRQPISGSDAYALMARPETDPVLQAGDVIQQPGQVMSVHVIAEDGALCERPWQPAATVRDYLVACRGDANAALPEAVVLMQGHGRAQRVNLAVWLPALTADVTPGSVIQSPVPGWPVAPAEVVRAQRDPLTRLARFWWQQAALPDGDQPTAQPSRGVTP